MRVRTDINLIVLTDSLREMLSAYTPLHCVCGNTVAWYCGDQVLMSVLPKTGRREFLYPTSGMWAVRCKCGMWCQGNTWEDWFTPGTTEPPARHAKLWEYRTMRPPKMTFRRADERKLDRT